MRFILGLLVLVGVFYALAGSMLSEGTYFVTAAEARARLGELAGQAVRVKGNVVAGTYRNPEGTNRHLFDIEEQGGVIHIAYAGPMPDVFKEGIEVVAEGRMDANGQLTATEIVAKCPSKYEEGKVPEAMKQKMSGQAPH